MHYIICLYLYTIVNKRARDVRPEPLFFNSLDDLDSGKIVLCPSYREKAAFTVGSSTQTWTLIL